MALRFPKLALGTGLLMAGGLLLGVAFAPAAAQQVSPIDGQVAVRSDGAVYLITNGQRRWVATVVITDEELNAYPEGEPIYAGLAPIGSAAAAASPGTATGVTTATAPTTAAGSSPPAPSAANTTGVVNTTGPSNTTGPTGTTGAANPAGAAMTATEVATPTGAISELDPQIPIEVDVDGPPKFEPGEIVTVNLRSKVGVTCELAVKWPDGNEVDQQSQSADGQGECEYRIDIPATASAGTVVLKGIAREGGRMSRQDVEFEIVPSS